MVWSCSEVATSLTKAGEELRSKGLHVGFHPRFRGIHFHVHRFEAFRIRHTARFGHCPRAEIVGGVQEAIQTLACGD